MNTLETVLTRFAEVFPIEEGWSEDRKFCVTDFGGKKFLLRFFDLEKADFKRTEFEMMKKVAAQGIPMCQPMEFGLCEDGAYCLLTWIEGINLSLALKDMDREKQYQYGAASGRILRRIQQTPVPPEELEESWEDYFNRKTDRRIAIAQGCPVNFRGQEEMTAYVQQHRHLLKGRPKTYQHGDYHVGNLMTDRSGAIQVIDFDRYEFGDPWEEFVRIIFDVEASVDFACGKIDGYFDCRVPEEFWELLMFYLASNEIAAPAWGLQFTDGTGEKMVRMAEEVYDWFDGMKNPVPSWYENQSKFAAAFREIMALSPAEYRRENGAKNTDSGQ